MPMMQPLCITRKPDFKLIQLAALRTPSYVVCGFQLICTFYFDFKNKFK